MNHLRLYLESTVGVAGSNKLFHEIDMLIIHSLKAVQGVINNDKYDMLYE